MERWTAWERTKRIDETQGSRNSSPLPERYTAGREGMGVGPAWTEGLEQSFLFLHDPHFWLLARGARYPLFPAWFSQAYMSETDTLRWLFVRARIPTTFLFRSVSVLWGFGWVCFATGPREPLCILCILCIL